MTAAARGLALSAAVAVAVAVAAAVAVGGCADGDHPRLTVSAATSLKQAFTEYGEAFEGAEVRLSFAGSDQLAAQIRAGARPDVFAAADTALPERLNGDGLVERPLRFAANRLVVAVPAEGRVKRVEDLARPGVRIAVGSPSVPVGAYARRAIERLPPGVRRNVRSEEPDVAGVVGKLRSGAVDAGFVYATDLRAVRGLRAIELPVAARPRVEYAAAVVRGSDHAEAARRFVRGLVSGPGRAALRRAGFEATP